MAERIHQLRQVVGLSRVELARRAGIPVSSMYLIEDGELDVRTSTLVKLATALGVRPDYLLGLADRAA
jgi:transcriptional regulator with XRE-family HTH domain